MLQVESALRESETRYKIMGEAVPYGVWLADAHGRVEYASDSFLGLLGISLEEMRTNDWANRLDPEQAQKMANDWLLCLETGDDWDQEYVLKDAHGILRTVWSRGKPVRNEQGQIVNWVGINLDVTERKRREQNAHFLASLGNQLVSPGDAKEVMRLISEQTGKYFHADECFFGDEDWELNNTIMIGGFRYGKEAFEARKTIDRIPAGIIDVLRSGQKVIVTDTATDPLTRSHYESLFKPGSIHSFVILPRMVDETWKGSFVILNKQPRIWLPDALELLESISNLAWLAIEQARIQQELRTAEERFRIALSSSTLFVFTMDRDLRYTWVHSPQFGFTPDQLLGKRDEELFPPGSLPKYTAMKQTVLETGQGLRQEVKDLFNNQWMYFFVTLEPLFDTQGNIIGLTGATLDITQQRRLEAEQMEYAAQMEVQRRLIQHREMERMDIARDLHDGVLQEMTALSFALSEAMMLDGKEARIERLQWVQQNLLKQSGEIRAFCNDLRPPALAPFGLEKAIRSHIDEYQKRHPDISVSLNLQSDRQTLPEDVRMALFRILQEVLNNVTKHAKATHVWITWTLDGEEACLEVEDDGVGFDVPDDWVAQARSGHLGLLGMRERVQSIGGQIQFDAHPGKGARVRVTVPRQPETT